MAYFQICCHEKDLYKKIGKREKNVKKFFLDPHTGQVQIQRSLNYDFYSLN